MIKLDLLRYDGYTVKLTKRTQYDDFPLFDSHHFHPHPMTIDWHVALFCLLHHLFLSPPASGIVNQSSDISHDDSSCWYFLHMFSPSHACFLIPAMAIFRQTLEKKTCSNFHDFYLPSVCLTCPGTEGLSLTNMG